MNLRSIASVAALAAAIGTSASHAVSLNPRGLGQVLIYPYYTVNKDQVTLLSVVNTSDVGKLVGVHVREGYNGRHVLLFRVFLSPHDTWTGAITQTADDGGAQLTTADSSCTSPAIPAEGVPFGSSLYDGQGFPNDGGPTGITRTREGMIELIAIADITPGSALDIATSHVQNGTPDGGVPPCTPDLMTPYYAGMFDMVAPTSGLAGSVAIVNVRQGTFFGYAADALTGFTEVPLVVPQIFLGESLLQANTADSTFVGGATAHILTDSGRPLALDYERGVDAVSAVFAADAIQNEYFIDGNLGAATDWVVTFPTKEYYVDIGYNSDGSDLVLPPFTESFSYNVTGQSNSEFVPAVYDREEGHAGTPVEIGPPTTHPNAFPYQVNALGFSLLDNVASPVLGSSLVANWGFPQFGNDGWASLDLASGDGGHAFPPDHNGIVLRGLPVTGFMVYDIINANAQPGTLANYGGAFPHHSTISCAGQGSSTDIAGCP